MGGQGTKGSYEDLFERYKLIVAARNFHYENFNKWLTYFYVANGAIFLGYTSVKASMELPTLSIGSAAGILLYWSSKGYYYWNINFIMLVNHYEKEVLKWKEHKRVYSVFANKGVQNDFVKPYSGANFSTSKIAILFSFIIATSWLTILSNTIVVNLFPNCFNTLFLWIIPLGLFIAMGALLVGLTRLVGNKKGYFLSSKMKFLDDLKLEQK